MITLVWLIPLAALVLGASLRSHRRTGLLTDRLADSEARGRRMERERDRARLQRDQVVAQLRSAQLQIAAAQVTAQGWRELAQLQLCRNADLSTANRALEAGEPVVVLNVASTRADQRKELAEIGAGP
jgi:hypothetical protein